VETHRARAAVEEDDDREGVVVHQIVKREGQKFKAGCRGGRFEAGKDDNFKSEHGHGTLGSTHR